MLFLRIGTIVTIALALVGPKNVSVQVIPQKNGVEHPSGLRRIGAWVGLDTAVILENKNLDPFISTLEKEKLRVYLRVDSIPPFIDTFFLHLGSGLLHNMGNPGQPWQSSDVVMDEPLPWNQLIWFGLGKNVAVLAFHNGGVGVSTRVLLLAFDTNRNVTDFWCGQMFGNVSPQRQLLRKLKSGKNKYWGLNTSALYF